MWYSPVLKSLNSLFNRIILFLRMFLENLACVFWGSFYHVLRVNLLNSFLSVFSFPPQRSVRTKLYDEQSRAMKTSAFHGLFIFLFPLLCSVNDPLLCSMIGRSFNCYGGYDSFVLIDSLFSTIYTIVRNQYAYHDTSSLHYEDSLGVYLTINSCS
jgi:hypothetical protein